eukprot:gene12061-14749_t
MKRQFSFLFISLAIIFTATIVIGQQQVINVVPYPQSVTVQGGSFTVSPNAFNITSSSDSTTLSVSIKRYLQLLFPFGNANTPSNTPQVTLYIKVFSSDESLFLGVDESYSLTTDQSQCVIQASTIYGAMRGLETFKQLVTYSDSTGTYSLPSVSITDSPRFPWRGFMIDTARHYQPKSMILHIIDALGYNKFNVLHWHIVDAQSFPVQSVTYPLLTKAAFNPSAIYTHADIQEIVAYAKTYGIRVIPEFDIPGHSYSWGVGYPQLVANCPNYQANINNIPLNPALPSTYTFLTNLFTEMSTLFPDAYFHTGGDEVVLNCWNQDPTISEWMSKMGYNTVGAEQYFENQLDGIMREINRTKIIWNDPFDNGVQIAPETLIHVWYGSDLQSVVDAGFTAIYSSNWYLDKQVPAGITHYEWQDTWIDFYNSDPTLGITTNADKIIGGEGTMWSEQINQFNWDVRVWPRSIAIAERLWSDQSINNPTTALPRIGAFSCDLSRRGVASGPLFTDYCSVPENAQTLYQP